MAKPTELAKWATDTNYPAGSEPEAGTPTKVAYTLGQEQVGWRPGQRPPAQELNTWMHRVGKWIDWIDQLTSAKWQWINGCHFTPLNAYGTPNFGSAPGFYGTIGETAAGILQIAEPVGTRLLQFGVKVRHAAGEPNGGVIGGLAIKVVEFPADGTNASNPTNTVAADPPATLPGYTLEILGNNNDGEKWETIVVDIDQTDDNAVVRDGIPYTILVSINGAQIIGAVGYKFVPMD